MDFAVLVSSMAGLCERQRAHACVTRVRSVDAANIVSSVSGLHVCAIVVVVVAVVVCVRACVAPHHCEPHVGCHGVLVRASRR